MPGTLSEEIVSDLRAVVLAATGSPKVSITRILETVAERFNAFGCGLWEQSPFYVSKKNSLITVAAWWKNGETFAMDDVPIDGSPTAKAIKKQFTLRVDDIQDPDQGGKKHNEPFWIENDIHPMCVAPFTFLDGSAGAVNIYRQSTQVFTEEEESRLSMIANLLPGLYRAAREKTELNLVKQIGGRLQHDDKANGKTTQQTSIVHNEGSPSQSLSERDIKKILREVCKLVGKAFGSVEVSMFFTETECATRVSLWATSNRRCVNKTSYDLITDDDKTSLTKHVLKTWRPITVPDMVKIDEYRSWLLKTYFYDSLAPSSHYSLHARKVLKKTASERLPPLTFAALPIFGSTNWHDNDLCGVLRCYGANAPYYFEERDVDVLTVVAQLVGDWWSSWRARVDLESENATWQRLASELDRMNLRTLEVLSDTSLVERAEEAKNILLREGLLVAEAVLQGAVLNGYRLINSANDDLRFDLFNDAARKLLEDDQGVVTRLNDFQTKDKSKWAWQVYKSGQTMIQRDLWHPSKRVVKDGYVPIFSQTTAILIAPVGVGTSRKGVMDLRWTGMPIPKYARAAATLIGQQVGIYLQLLDSVIDLQREKGASLRDQLMQQRIYDDFSHQMKSPITQARRRLEEAVRAYGSNVAPRPLLVARGLVRRVHRVAQSMRMLRSISKGESLSIIPHQIDKSALIKSMQEIGTDAANQYAKGVNFEIDDVSIQRLNLNHFRFDLESVEQCLSNLMDNAVKYSRKNSTASAWGGIDSMGRFYIAVANNGIRILPSEIARIGERGWRSYAAKAITPDGQGIGLWLIKELLHRQSAELVTVTTNMFGMTEFRLAFNRHIHR